VRSDPFDGLLAEYQRRIYFFIRSMVFDPEDAKDLLQDVNMIILRKRSRFTPGTDFKSWSFAIARFECLVYLKRRKKNQEGIADFSEEVAARMADAAERRADDLAAWLGALDRCRRELPEDAVRLLDMRYTRRLPLGHLAADLETTEGALKQKLLRIRNRLRRCILARTGQNPNLARNLPEDLE
jgi:RNA polymerase sigma-70 factor (ECF subfamily)